MVDNEEKYFADCEEDPGDSIPRIKRRKMRLYPQSRYRVMNERSRHRWEKVVKEMELFLETIGKTDKKVPRHIEMSAREKVKTTPIFERLEHKRNVICGEEERLVSMLELEAEMIEMVDKIQAALSIERCSWEEALIYLIKFRGLKVTPLMLKKNPRVVFAIRMLLLYNGHHPEQDLDEEDKAHFLKGAKLIRGRAVAIYETFKLMFRVPPSHSFIEIFRNEVAYFEELMEGLTKVQEICLVEDPEEWADGLTFELERLKVGGEEEPIKRGRTSSTDFDSS